MKKYIMLILIILGSLFTSAIAVIQFLQSESDKKESEKSERALNHKIDNLLASNLKQSNQISDLSLANTALSKQLAKTAIKLQENTIGGSTIYPDGFLIDDTHFKIELKNIDNKIIYNASATIIELEKLKTTQIIDQNDKVVNFSSKNIQDYCDQFGSGDIVIGSCLRGNKVYELANNKEAVFYIEFNNRKNFQIIQLCIKNQNGVFGVFYRIYEVSDDKWTLVKKVGSVKEERWAKIFYEKRRLGYYSNK